MAAFLAAIFIKFIFTLIMAQKFDKILVIQTAFLGDVILATAVIEKLLDYYPKAEYHFVLRKGNEGVLQGHPYLKKIWVLDKSQKYRNLRRMIGEVRKEKFDLVVNLQRFATTGLLTALSGAKTKIGFSKNPMAFTFDYTAKHEIGGEKRFHEVERNQKLIRHITDDQPSKPVIYPSDEDYSQVEQLKHKSYICMAPASVWFTKQWAKSKWVDLIDALSHKYVIYLLGGPGDKALCEEILSSSRDKDSIEVVAGKLSPLASAALMKNAVMNYVNDSAPLHFASAVDAPVVAIYCSTSPDFGFGPLASNGTIVETKDNLPCRPCGVHGRRECPEGHFKCALTIELSNLLKPLNQLSNG